MTSTTQIFSNPPPLHVFLSGRVDGIPLDVSSSWRHEAAGLLTSHGCRIYDPTRVIVAAESGYQARPNEVFTNDRRQLNITDVLLVNLDLPTHIASHDAPFFTIGEMFLAHARELPVITFGACFRGRPGYEAVVTRSFDQLTQAVDYILLHYLPCASAPQMGVDKEEVK